MHRVTLFCMEPTVYAPECTCPQRAYVKLSNAGATLQHSLNARTLIIVCVLPCSPMLLPIPTLDMYTYSLAIRVCLMKPSLQGTVLHLSYEYIVDSNKNKHTQTNHYSNLLFVIIK